MKDVGIWAFVLFALFSVSCSQSHTPTGANVLDAASLADASQSVEGGISTDDDGGPSCQACGPAEGCLRAVVVCPRTATSQLPWLEWGGQSDGIGTLVVTLWQGEELVARKSVPDANMRPETARYEVEFGCVPSQRLSLRAFLDDNLNAGGDASSSDDYADTCLVPVVVHVDVSAGGEQQVELQLNVSCDPERD
jgi:hypothetical protein